MYYLFVNQTVCDSVSFLRLLVCDKKGARLFVSIFVCLQVCLLFVVLFVFESASFL